MGLIVDILRGMRDENDRLPHDDDAEENAAMLAASLNSGFPAALPTHHVANARGDLKDKTASSIGVAKFLDGSTRKINYNNVRETDSDEYTNERHE